MEDQDIGSQRPKAKLAPQLVASFIATLGILNMIIKLKFNLNFTFALKY